MNTKYKQVKLQYESHAIEIVWIPEQFAHTNKKLKIGKMITHNAIVLEVFGDISHTKDEIEINQTYPLWKVTDI